MNKIMTSVRKIENNIEHSKGHMKLKLRKNAPTIMTVSGVGFVLFGTVLACKATTKMPDILDETKESLEKLKARKDGDNKKEKAKIYAKAAGNTVKEYAPAAVSMTAGIGLILGSHKIMKNRNTSIAAGYAALDAAYRKYRERVKEKYGEDAERDIRYGITRSTVDVIEDNGDGKKPKKTKVEVAEIKDPLALYSPYAKFFDESCIEWTKDPEYNMTFLRLVQNQMNDKLKAQGHLFLNEVYDALGIARTSMGNRVGWIYDLRCPNGDNFVDFGLYNQESERVRAFVNGHENVILLDFNVDGTIIDSI